MNNIIKLGRMALCAAIVGMSASLSARTLEVTNVNRVGGIIQSVDVSVSAGDPVYLLRAIGTEDGGADIMAWDAVDNLGQLDAAATNVTVAVPSGWDDTIHAMRVFISESPRYFANYDYALDYIQGAGAQYLNTEYFPNKNTHLELTFSHEDTSHDQMAYGVRRDNGSYCIAVWFNRASDATLGRRYSANPMLGSQYVNKDDKLGGCPLALGTVVTFSQGLDVGLVVTPEGGEPFVCYGPGSFSSTEVAATKPLLIMGMYTADSIEQRKFYGKFYGGRILESGVVVRDYQPCVKDGVPGIWDFCEKKFYVSETETAFGAGSRIAGPQLGGPSTGTYTSGSVVVPVLEVSTVPWTGAVQKPDIAREGMTIDWGEGDWAAPGTYTAVCSLSDATLYHWADKTTGSKSVSFTIEALGRPIAVTTRGGDDGFIHVLSFSAATEGATLYRLRGATDKGVLKDEWDSAEIIGGVHAGATSIEVPVPNDFTSGTMRYVLAEGVYPDKQLECVSTVGGACFDTGIYATMGSTRTEIDFQFTQDPRKQDRLLAARTSTWSAMPNTVLHYEVYVNGNNQGACCCRIGGQNASNGTVGTASKNRATCVLDAYNKYFTWFGTGRVTSSFNQTAGVQSERTICIPTDPLGTGGTGARGNLFGVIISEKDVPVCEFVPAEIDGAAGLYDRLNGTFTASANAEAAFGAGTEVALTVQPGCAYVPTGVSEALAVQTSPIVEYAVSGVDSSSISVTWTLTSVGTGADSAEVTLKWGTSSDALDNSVTLAATGAAGANGTYRIENLVQGQQYYLQIIADNGNEISDSPILAETVKTSIALKSAEAQSNGAMRFAWELLALADGATSADITLCWGYSADSLSNVLQVQDDAVVGDSGHYDAIAMAEDEEFYAKFVATDDNGGTAESAVVKLTMPLRPVEERGLLRGLRIANTTNVDGQLASVDLALDPSDLGITYGLYVATAAAPGEKDLSKWTYTKLGDVTDETTAWHFTEIPAGWGTSLFAMRFFLTTDVDSLRYSRKGLFAQWDGIDNAAYGVHEERTNLKTTPWNDLVGDLDFTAAGTAVVYTTNSVQTAGGGVDGGNYATVASWLPASYIAGKSFTIELAIRTYGFMRYAGIFAFGIDDSGGTRRVLCLNGDGTGASSSTMYALQCLSSSFPNDAPTGLPLMTQTNVAVAVTVDPLGAHLYIDGQFVHTTRAGGLTDLSNTFGLGRYSTQTVKNDFYSVRLYNRPLNDDEIAADAAIDRIRFFGAEETEPLKAVEWSETLTWTDPNRLAFDSATVDVSSGTHAVYSGNVNLLDGMVASDVTITLYAGESADLAERTATVLGSPNADGSFSFTESASPGDVFYWTLEATPAEWLKAQTSKEAQVIVPSASGIGGMNVIVDNLEMEVDVTLDPVGAGDTQVKVVWGTTQGVFNHETEMVVASDGHAKIVFKVPAETTYYIKAIVTNAAGDDTWTDESDVQVRSAFDMMVYTWIGSAEGAWDDSANWAASSNTGFGFPNGSATAVFDGATAIVNVTNDYTVGTIQLDGVFDVTFAGGKQLTTGAMPVSGKKDWKLQIVDGTKVVMQNTNFGDYSGTENCLVSVRGEGALFNPARFALGGVSNRIEVFDGGYLWAHGQATCFGGEASVLLIDNASIGGKTFNPGDIQSYETVPPKVILRGENPTVPQYYGDGSFKNPGMVAADWEFDIPKNGYVSVPVYNSQKATDIFPREIDSGSQPAKAGWQRFSVPKTAPFLSQGKGTIDQQLIFWELGINTNRVELTKLPNGGEWFFTYGTDKQNPLAAPAKEGDKPTGIWARLSAHSGTMLIVR